MFVRSFRLFSIRCTKIRKGRFLLCCCAIDFFLLFLFTREFTPLKAVRRKKRRGIVVHVLMMCLKCRSVNETKVHLAKEMLNKCMNEEWNTSTRKRIEDRERERESTASFVKHQLIRCLFGVSVPKSQAPQLCYNSHAIWPEALPPSILLWRTWRCR